MFAGGLFDHIGGGFVRYSTDEKWLVSHFEKMLYDNALLAIIYLEVYQLTYNTFFASVAERIFTYILRDMTFQKGDFFQLRMLIRKVSKENFMYGVRLR